MDYADWIQRVFDVAVSTWQAVESDAGPPIAIPVGKLAQPLGLLTDPAGFYGSDAHHALIEAVRDLEGIGLIKIGNGNMYSFTDRGELAFGKQISSGWRTITDVQLTARQDALLRNIAELAVQEQETYVRLIHVNAAEALTRSGLTEAPHIFLAATLARQLADKGLAEVLPIQDPTMRPTYAGFIRATKRVVSEDQRLVTQLLLDWETVETDVKEILKLDSPTEKGEFTRDVLGLVNTKARAKRYLLLGFNNETREFTTSPDPKNTQDRMEDVLGSHCAPLPMVRYRLVPWESGMAGLIEVLREPTKLPYRATSTDGKLKEDAVYVRHGTHVTEADPLELADLITEGDLARQIAATPTT